MKRLSCVLVLALAACSSSKSAPQTMPAAADGPTCGEASDHTIDLLSKGAPDAPPDLVKKIRDTLASHCEKDQWSAASRTCFAKLATKEDAQKCEDGLTPAQRESLDKENVGAGGPGGPDGGAAPQNVGSPPPGSVPAAGGSRSPTTKGGPKKGGDPEDGGE